MKLLIWSLSAALLIPPAFQLPTDEGRIDRRAISAGAASRFLARKEPELTSAIALRHLSASTRGGSMTGWIDACTALEAGELRYWIVAEGGSGTIRKRALVAALDGEIKARKEHVARAALDPANYEFAPAVAEDGLLRVGLTPRRKDAMLIDGAMFLSPEDADLVRLEGRLVKPPSFWTRQVKVVRRYGRNAGVRVPLSMESTAKVLIVGTSTFAMSYRYLSVNGRPVSGELGPASSAQVCAAGAGEARSTMAIASGDRPTMPAAMVDSPGSAAEHHQKGVDFHLQHRLADASAEYAKTLALDPPRAPTADEQRLVERFAPRVFVTESEPFALRDFAAVIHPDQSLIAYHFFWDDDIDFPDDDEPSDHELVWVHYTQDGRLSGFETYFHGRVLDGGKAAVDDANAHDQRPAVYVQWGKHGSMPAGWQQQQIEGDEGDIEASYLPGDGSISLERFNRAAFDRLSKDGPRAVDHPLARRDGWPKRFTGSWVDFSTFPRSVDALTLLNSRKLVMVSRWNSATINQRFLHYNFKPKLEWPDEE